MSGARWVIAAGVVAALHVGKLPPALPVLQQVLGVSLLQAGFLLSLVQLAGMTLGLVTGIAVQRVGLKRSMVAGLLVLGSASALGALAHDAGSLLATRALEGLGFLWVVLPAPALVRGLVPQNRLNGMLGVWGAYMPLGTSLALLLGPQLINSGTPDGGWRVWWGLLAAVTGVLAGVVAWRVPSRSLLHVPLASPRARAVGRQAKMLLSVTLRSRAAWVLALTFAMYSGQWLSVVGFLPTL